MTPLNRQISRAGSCLPLGLCPGLASGGFGRRIDPFPGLYIFCVRAEMSLPTRTKENRRDGKNDKP